MVIEVDMPKSCVARPPALHNNGFFESYLHFFACERDVAPRIAQLTHADERKIAQMRYDVTNTCSKR